MSDQFMMNFITNKSKRCFLIFSCFPTIWNIGKSIFLFSFQKVMDITSNKNILAKNQLINEYSTQLQESQVGQEFYSLNWIRPKNSEMKSLWALMPILKCKLENRTQPKLLYVYPKVYRDHHYLGILQVPTFHNDPQHCLLMSKHLICRFALSLDNYGWPVAVYLFFTGSI